MAKGGRGWLRMVRDDDWFRMAKGWLRIAG